MTGLADRSCIPCKGGVAPLAGEALARLHGELGGGWELVGGHHLEKEFRFKDFRQALEFVDRVGEMSEEQGHHPEIFFTWGKARLKIYTHKIDGLTESDFVWAAKAERLAS
jgi:4a-hydroxytetrahydrobiopterin dehydratase